MARVELQELILLETVQGGQSSNDEGKVRSEDEHTRVQDGRRLVVLVVFVVRLASLGDTSHSFARTIPHVPVATSVDIGLYATRPTGEKLNDEETRILGVEKLAEPFTKVRWQSPDEKDKGVGAPPVRFLPTTLSPAASVRDDVLMHQRPLQKKVKSEREIGDMSLSTIAKAMREDDGVPIENNHWHRMQYQNSFTEFAGRRAWNFLDGHYFYRLIGEYLPTTPARQKSSFVTPPMKRRLILSETMVIDIDTNKRPSGGRYPPPRHHPQPSDRVFHFELQEDQLRQWNTTIERYGLKIVEVHVTQISDIRDRSAFPVRLAAPPPSRARPPPAPARRHPHDAYALRGRFGFILDVEASDLYPDDVYCSTYKYSQFIHRSGVAFIQLRGGTEGFLFLPWASGKEEKRWAVELRVDLDALCSNPAMLEDFYRTEVKPTPPEPRLLEL
ncbi:hypothetical protein BDZ89DRAFT_1147525 [Hymenopellis radicata]|nr:hypothetical protein BDZ89DRAFT_1147525 [Hymenopellis radicata]